MSFKSRRTITSMIAGVLLGIVYIVYAIGNRAPAPEDFKAWAVTMLIFTGIGVVMMIVIQILFHIGYAIGVAVKERERDSKEIDRIIASATAEDEMEKLITLKSARVGQVCIGVGFIAALFMLAFGGTAVDTLHIMLGSYFGGNIVEGGVSVYLYERGVRNG